MCLRTAVDSQAKTERTVMNAAHLEKFDDRQREAVEHGTALTGPIDSPRLIIAGADARARHPAIGRSASVQPL